MPTRRPLACLLLAAALAAAVGLTPPAPAGAGTVPPGGVTAAACFVDRAHDAFLDRDATEAEIDEWTEAFADGTPRYVLITALTRAEEWLEVTVAQIYELALGRPPDAAGLAYWVGELRDGALVNRIGAQIFGSPEFYARAGGTDEGFVEDLYDLILDRAPDTGGLTYWIGQVAARGRGGVAGEFYASVESRSQRVRDLYVQLLDREPSAPDLAYWTDRLRTVNDVRLAALIASSAEFADRTRERCRLAVTIVTDALPDGRVGTAYTADLEAEGGLPPYSWSATDLPAGLSVVGDQIVGTPTEDGEAEVTVTVTDAEGGQEDDEIDLTVAAGVVDIAFGTYHSCAALGDGTARCWGFNSTGQLGVGGTVGATTPQPVPGLTGVTDVAAAGASSCAVIGGPVRCWGSDSAGQLGNGAGGLSDVPVAVVGLTDAVAVDAEAFSACALRTSGAVRCWGSNAEGQLGDGTTTDAQTPVAVSGLTDATQVGLGVNFACALKVGGTVVCWGSNSDGRLGHGAGSSSTPVTVSGITGATGLAVGWQHACAVLADATLRCWGENSDGQLGDGTTTDRSTPVAVPGTAATVDVGAGSRNTCTVRSNGTVRCWGSTAEGAIGTGTNPVIPTAVTAPTLVPGAVGSEAIVLGDSSAFAVGPGGGALLAWGQNGAGQLGDGSGTDRATPVAVTF